jgi:hypothetical protein
LLLSELHDRGERSRCVVYRNGQRFIGEFVRGEKTGEWFHRSRRQTLRRTGAYQKGMWFAALKG